MANDPAVWLGGLLVVAGLLTFVFWRGFRLEKVSLLKNQVVLKKPIVWQGTPQLRLPAFLLGALGVGLTIWGGWRGVALSSASDDLPKVEVCGERADNPAFSEPLINGRTIDACIKSYLFPETFERQCDRAAQQVIVDEFCACKGYSVGYDWETVDTGEFQRSYKLFVEKDASGKVTPQWVQDNTGGAIFTYIACT